MKTIEEHLIDLDDFLKSEAEAFDKSAKSAIAVKKPLWGVHCQACADMAKVARSWIHVNILHSRIEPGDVLTVCIIKKLRAQGVPDKLMAQIEE